MLAYQEWDRGFSSPLWNMEPHVYLDMVNLWGGGVILNRVCVDGVGKCFPFFFVFPCFFFSFVFLCFSLLFSHSLSLRGQGQTTAIYCRHGESHSEPVCTNRVQNFLKFVHSSKMCGMLASSWENLRFCFGGFPLWRLQSTPSSEALQWWPLVIMHSMR